MYVRLCEGKTVNKAEEARRFGVDERSIQRDIDDIRAFLDEKSVDIGDGREIIYNATKCHGYIRTSVTTKSREDRVFYIEHTGKIFLNKRRGQWKIFG